MANGRIPWRPRLNASQQSAMIIALYPSFKMVHRGKQYVWEGYVQPTPLCERYKVRICYQQGDVPKVNVVSPPLVPREEDGHLKHIYPGNRLCLYTPGEWSNETHIAHTVIPWISLWLFYYELWHATGKWLGGGHEPGSKEETDDVGERS